MIKKNGNCVLQAHRGVSSDYPENTLVAYRAAVELGYGMIELDARFTSDNKCVMMHDHTLNRTTRNMDGTPLVEETKICDVKFDYVRGLDAGLHKGECFKGEHVPTLEEVLELTIETGVPLKFDNILEQYTPEQLDIFLSTIDKMKAWENVGFTVRTVEFAKKILKVNKFAHIHFDGPLTDENLKELSQILPREQLTVWGRFDNETTSWCKVAPVDENMAKRVHEFAELGVWLLNVKEEYDVAVNCLGASIVETNGTLKP